jgi:thioredoxin reductase (NADPH)
MTETRLYNVAILGSSPAGLQAAIHAARRKVSELALGEDRQSSIFQHIRRKPLLGVRPRR